MNEPHRRYRPIVGVESLTARELEIAKLYARGARVKDIAAELNLGVPTVKTCCTKILDKLNIAGTNEIARLIPVETP